MDNLHKNMVFFYHQLVQDCNEFVELAVAVIASNFAAPAQGMTMEKGNQTGMMSSNMTSGNMTTGNITAGGSSNMTK